MLVVKYPNTYPFYDSASELEDLIFSSGTIRWVKDEDSERLVEARISTVSYSLGDEIHAASSQAWHNTSLLWNSLQMILIKFNEVQGLASIRVTNAQFKVTCGGLVDQPLYKPYAYSFMIGDLNRAVYGKLPKEWGEFPPLTVLTAANAIKGKVDEYLSTQENLDKILREVG